MLDDIVLAASTSQAKAAKKTISVVLEAMKFVCSVYDVNFRTLVETHGDVAGDLLEEKVDFVLMDPPFNIRYAHHMGHSSFDVPTPENMSDLLEFGSRELIARAHRHSFCSWMQLSEWYKKLQCVRQESPNFEADPEGEICTSRKVFEVKSVSLHYTQAPGNHQKDPCAEKLSRTSVV